MAERREFRERVAALLGRTAYRETCGGRSTRPGLTDLDVAAALAMGRLRRPNDEPDPTDIGPEVAYGMACLIRHRKPDVCSAVQAAIVREMSDGRGRQKPMGHWRLAYVTNAAYEFLVMGEEIKRHPEIPSNAWDFFFNLAFSAMLNSAEAALVRAERAFYREPEHV